jgi:hypothetical protein
MGMGLLQAKMVSEALKMLQGKIAGSPPPRPFLEVCGRHGIEDAKAIALWYDLVKTFVRGDIRNV